jgi:hypothetical protein
MAFLVCYSRYPPEYHTEDRAIYLDQAFYQMIFEQCRNVDCGYTILRDIALLRYKSPTLVVPTERLETLHNELTRLARNGACDPQLSAFQQIVDNALNSARSLTISGDMYPEL